MTSDGVQTTADDLNDALRDRMTALKTRGLIAVAAAAAVLAGISIGGIVGDSIDVLALCAVVAGIGFTGRLWQANRAAAHYAASLYKTDPSSEALMRVPPKIVRRARAITESGS